MLNPLKQLEEQGQSIWLDYVRRSLITGGDLQRLVEVDGLSGVTITKPGVGYMLAASEKPTAERPRRLIPPGWSTPLMTKVRPSE